MLILVLAVCLILIGVAFWLDEQCYETASCVCAATSIVVGIGALTALCLVLVAHIDLKPIDAKIEMYEAENAHIENQIAECVKQYQEYEEGIFTEVAPKDAVTLVTLYPELKADGLVAKQIEVYIANNEKIKELKEEKLNGDIYKWWLYFGGGEE